MTESMSNQTSAELMADVTAHGDDFLGQLSKAINVPVDAPVEPEAVSQPTEPTESATADAVTDDPTPESTDETESQSEDADDEDGDTQDASPTEPTTPESQSRDPFAEIQSIATKEGKPFSYTVNGESRTFEGIVDLGDKGAYVPPAELSRLRSQFSLAAKSIEDNRDLFALKREVEAVGGFEKMEELTRNVQKLDAMGGTLLEVFKDANELLALLEQDKDGAVRINERAMKHLLERMDIASTKADFAAREQFQTQRTSFREASNAGAEQERTLKQAVDLLGEGLPDADKTAAVQFFSQFRDTLFRKATQEDVAQFPDGGFKVGQVLLDVPKMAAWFEDRKALRRTTTASETKKVEAQKENTARQAAPTSQQPLPPRKTNGQFKKPKPSTNTPKARPTIQELQRMVLRGESLAD